MKFLSRLCVALVVGVALTCAATESLGAPDGAKTAEINTVAGQNEAGRLFRNQKQEKKADPKHENLQKLADAPKKFVFAAGATVIAVVINVAVIVFIIIALLTVFLYFRNRAGGNKDRTDSLARAFDSAVGALKSERKKLQTKVNKLAKREGKLQPAEKPKTRRKPRAKKTTS